MNEIVHLILKYLEIIINLNFIYISILLLEFRAGIEKKDKNVILSRNRTENNVHNLINDSAKTNTFIAVRFHEKIN